MKKLAKLCICGAAVVALSAGCSAKTTEETTTAVETTAETTAEGETAAEGETTAESTEAETEPVDKGTVVLGEYKGLEIPAVSTEVTEDDINERIDSILAANPDYEVITDRAAEEGDIVNIDYVGKKDGVAFDGGTAEGYDLTLGSGAFIDGFEDGLIGVKTGEKKDLNLTFPEEYPSADLAGQAVVFEVTVNEIKKEKEAVLNDEFVKKVSEAADVDAFKKEIEADLKAEKESMGKMEQQNAALMAALENCEFQDTDAYVEAQFNEQYEQLSNMAAMSGIAMADYAAMYGMDEEGFKSYLKSNTEVSVQISLMTEAIAEKEQLTITEEDYQEVAEMNYAENIEDLVAAYGQEQVDASAMNIRVIKFLVENAVIKE